MPSPSTSPTWYDILGVRRDADEQEIRRAWREATDRFGPGAGGAQFAMYNEAAEVLLDPERRRHYDESLDLDHADDADHADHADQPVGVGSAGRGAGSERATTTTTERPRGRKVAGAGAAAGAAAALGGILGRRSEDAGRGDERRTTTADGPAAEPSARRRAPRRAARSASARLLVLSAALAVLTVVAVVVGVLAWRQQSDRDALADARAQAPAAAERAMPAVLSYDYRTLPADRARAEGYLTPAYRAKYDRTFKLLETDQSGKPGAAVQTKAVVKANVLSSGVTDLSADLVRVLVFVDQTSQKAGQDPQVFQNRVAVTMKRSGGRWLVDNLKSY